MYQRVFRSVAYSENFFRGEGGYTKNFFGGFQQIQLRIEDRENGDLGAVAPSQGFR
jgi:hypothetical protein